MRWCVGVARVACRQGKDFDKPTEKVMMTYDSWTTALDKHEADPKNNPHVYYKASSSVQFVSDLERVSVEDRTPL